MYGKVISSLDRIKSGDIDLSFALPYELYCIMEPFLACVTDPLSTSLSYIKFGLYAMRGAGIPADPIFYSRVKAIINMSLSSSTVDMVV